MSETLPDSSGQNWPIKSQSAQVLIMELEPLKTLIFDWSEIQTLRALVDEHKALKDAADQVVAEAENLDAIDIFSESLRESVTELKRCAL